VQLTTLHRMTKSKFFVLLIFLFMPMLQFLLQESIKHHAQQYMHFLHHKLFPRTDKYLQQDINLRKRQMDTKHPFSRPLQRHCSMTWAIEKPPSGWIMIMALIDRTHWCRTMVILGQTTILFTIAVQCVF